MSPRMPENISEKDPITSEDLVDRFGDYLYRFALSRVRSPEVAEDLVQETFLAALQKLDTFRGDSALRTWLTGILKNKILDHYKKAGRENYFDEIENVAVLADAFAANGRWDPERTPVNPGSDPATLFELKEFQEILEECLRRLPPRMARIFSMRELGGMSGPEIRKLTRVSTSNFSVILHRARMQLQSCIGESWSV